MTPKIPLIRERRCEFFRRCTKAISSSLPFFEREGSGYVHHVRSACLHYDDAGKITHTSVTFWCGSYGFLYPKGKQSRNKAPASMVAEPTAGRLVCATCAGRAVGSGQLGEHKIGPNFVKYRPHSPFFGAKPKEVSP